VPRSGAAESWADAAATARGRSLVVVLTGTDTRDRESTNEDTESFGAGHGVRGPRVTVLTLLRTSVSLGAGASARLVQAAGRVPSPGGRSVVWLEAGPIGRPPVRRRWRKPAEPVVAAAAAMTSVGSSGQPASAGVGGRVIGWPACNGIGEPEGYGVRGA